MSTIVIIKSSFRVNFVVSDELGEVKDDDAMKAKYGHVHCCDVRCGH